MKWYKWNKEKSTRSKNGNPHKIYRSLPIPEVHRILPIFHPRILANRPTATRPHKESDPMALEYGPTESIQRTT